MLSSSMLFNMRATQRVLIALRPSLVTALQRSERWGRSSFFAPTHVNSELDSLEVLRRSSKGGARPCVPAHEAPDSCVESLSLLCP